MQMKRREELPDAKLQMTSMIDIVFLLVIFFLCVSEMRKMQDAAITLPMALIAHKDEPVPPGRLTINVDDKGRYLVGREVYEPARLKALIMESAERHGRSADKLSTLPVKIRADANVAYKQVQRVLLFCMNAKVWQISFGVSPKGAAQPSAPST